jgi:SAM-dependent methyltransferase
LFSSFDVDPGSRFLLSAIAKSSAGATFARVADLGCGTGVLGVAVAAAWGCQLHLYDRDALALSVAALNAANCHIEPQLHGGLGCRDLAGAAAAGDADLVVCNLPAKAGAPVRAALLADAAALLAPGGLLAVVVVAALAGETRTVLEGFARISYHESSADHAVFAGEVPQAVPPADPESYQRRRSGISLRGEHFELTTVYGLADFDTPSHLTETMAGLLANRPNGERDGSPHLLLWNPGQGDLLTWFLATLVRGAPRPEVVLASRDALQLSAGERNLAKHGYAPACVVHVPSCTALAKVLTAADRAPFDLLIVNVDEDSVRVQGGELLPALRALLDEHGRICIGGRAVLLNPVLQHRRGLGLVKQVRRKGQLAALLEKI